MELASDHHLAHFIISLTLPIHEYPNIVAQVNSVVKGKDTCLYTECTTKQFHSLLCQLLTFFWDHLDNLKSRNSKKPSSKAILSQFEDCVSHVVMCGYGLQALANSNALRMHLENIEDLLNDHHRSESNPMPKVKREEDPQEDVELEQDAELKAVHFSTTTNGM